MKATIRGHPRTIGLLSPRFHRTYRTVGVREWMLFILFLTGEINNTRGKEVACFETRNETRDLKGHGGAKVGTSGTTAR